MKYKRIRFKSVISFYINIIEYSNNNIDKKYINQCNKNFSTLKITKKISFFHKPKNYGHKSISINDTSVEKMKKKY